jgi:hypothetical protein
MIFTGYKESTSVGSQYSIVCNVLICICVKCYAFAFERLCLVYKALLIIICKKRFMYYLKNEQEC